MKHCPGFTWVIFITELALKAPYLYGEDYLHDRNCGIRPGAAFRAKHAFWSNPGKPGKHRAGAKFSLALRASHHRY